MNKSHTREYKYTEGCGFLTITSNIKWKSLLINIAIPLAVGGIASLITMDGFKSYADVTKPPLSPPSWVFPVVWTILYILMGIASYLVYESKDEANKKALTFYLIQLALNFIWPIFFFGFDAYLFSFILLIILIVFVVLTTVSFYRINTSAGLIMLPYLIWLCFAAYLNLGVYILN